MIYRNDIFTIEKLEYRVELSEMRGRKVATITPVLKIVSSARTLIITAVLVDGHELVSSFKATVEEGAGSLDLKYVKIVNPITREAGDRTTDKLYKLTVELYPPNDEPVQLERYIEIPHT